MTDTKQICDAIKGLIELADQLPQYLRSDWQDTNHFELTDGSVDAKDYFWIDFSDMFLPSDNDGMWCDGETGKRVGLVMDCVASLSANVGKLKALVAENESLEAEVKVLRDWREAVTKMRDSWYVVAHDDDLPASTNSIAFQKLDALNQALEALATAESIGGDDGK